MDADASASGAIALSRHDTHGICYHGQHVRCCLRTSLGWFDTVYCVGHVVGRCCAERRLLPLATFPNVSWSMVAFDRNNLALCFPR